MRLDLDLHRCHADSAPRCPTRRFHAFLKNKGFGSASLACHACLIRLMLKPLASLAPCLAGACAQAVPNALLNPDVTPATLGQTICRAGYTRTVRPSTSFTNGIKKRLLREQSMDFEAGKGGYELDHIIPLALGGHPRNVHNLTLQPWEGPYGAKRKNRLEVKLQCLVCSGEVALYEAQDAIWLDWKTAYAVLWARGVSPRPRTEVGRLRRRLRLARRDAGTVCHAIVASADRYPPPWSAYSRRGRGEAQTLQPRSRRSRRPNGWRSIVVTLVDGAVLLKSGNKVFE